MDYFSVQDAFAETGLIVLGGFHPEPADEIPGGPGTVIIVGNAGPDMWAAFARGTPAEERRDGENPLDGWTRRVLAMAAESLGAQALFPFTGPPYLPFQRWALRSGVVFPSPIGPLIHPEYGLWHAYRGALAFDERLDLPDPPTGSSPCESCADKPCLGACPVDAFGPREDPEAPAPYDIPLCVAHVSSAVGGDCLGNGCLARRACPVGRDYVYAPEQARFHMERFLKAQS